MPESMKIMHIIIIQMSIGWGYEVSMCPHVSPVECHVNDWPSAGFAELVRNPKPS